MHVFIELEEQSSTGRENSSSYGKYHISQKSSRSDQNIRLNNERILTAMHDKSNRIQDSSESSDHNTDYDSSIEDPNERLDRFLAFNRKN
jgi:hypothetical protein